MLSSSKALMIPTIWTLPTTRKTFLVEELCGDRHEDAFWLICDAAKRGDNIGIDEISTTEKFESKLRHAATTLTLSDVETKTIECLLLVEECRFVRSVHPTLASLYIVTSRKFSKKIFWQDLIQLAQTVVIRASSHGFSAFVVEVFVTCVERMMAFREVGFFITSWVPDAGKLAGFPGFCSSYIMYKQFASCSVRVSKSIFC